jgi:hypothetical protein
MKTPAFQFYPGDWRKDPELRSISLTARGLWIELLCLMHESSRKGFLVTKTGNSYTNEQLSRMVGVDIQTLEICLTEIETSGVSSREESTGILYSRRMVKDATISQERREAGKMGGNPALLNHRDNHRDKRSAKQTPTPSSSSSSSSSSSEEDSTHPLLGEGGRSTKSRDIGSKNVSNVTRPIPAQIQPRFPEWWKAWSAVRGTNHYEDALRAWGSVVSDANVGEVFSCTESYLASLDSNRGYNPETFLFDQVRAGFEARWPPARAAPSRKEESEEDWDFLEDKPGKKGASNRG